MAALVGRARAKYGVLAPAMTGHPDFERANRVHMNTLENLIIFIPAVWIFATYVERALGGGSRLRVRRRSRGVCRRLPAGGGEAQHRRRHHGHRRISCWSSADLIGLARALVLVRAAVPRAGPRC